MTRLLFRSVAATSMLLLATTVAAQNLSSADRDFMRKAAESGQTETTASQMAEKRSARSDVKQLASQLVTDHTRISNELKALASSKGVDLPDKPSASQRRTLQSLEKKEAEAFDSAYMKEIGIDAHQSSVRLFERTEKDAKDPEVKAFAAKTLPTLKHHLQMAQEVNRAVNKR